MTTTRSKESVMSETAIAPVLYRVDEAAEALRLSRSVVYELIRSGRLRTVKEGRRRLVPVSALAEYVALLEADAA
jgi:excisionase family DNA binding protein